MARVEWTRHSGDDVEAVLAMLVCSQFPNAVRVRPSQGDGGIDVFVPGPAGWDNERAVYQVKRLLLRVDLMANDEHIRRCCKSDRRSRGDRSSSRLVRLPAAKQSRRVVAGAKEKCRSVSHYRVGQKDH